MGRKHMKSRNGESAGPHCSLICSLARTDHPYAAPHCLLPFLICSFARNVHSYACSTLLALLPCLLICSQCSLICLLHTARFSPSFAHLLAMLTHILATHCSLHSLVCSFSRNAYSYACSTLLASLPHLLNCSHCSLISLLRTACFACSLICSGAKKNETFSYEMNATIS